MTTDHDKVISCKDCKFFEAKEYCTHWISRHGVFIKARDARQSVLCGAQASSFKHKTKPLIPATINFFMKLIKRP